MTGLLLTSCIKNTFDFTWIHLNTSGQPVKDKPTHRHTFRDKNAHTHTFRSLTHSVRVEDPLTDVVVEVKDHKINTKDPTEV